MKKFFGAERFWDFYLLFFTPVLIGGAFGATSSMAFWQKVAYLSNATVCVFVALFCKQKIQKQKNTWNELVNLNEIQFGVEYALEREREEVIALVGAFVDVHDFNLNTIVDALKQRKTNLEKNPLVRE